MKEDEVEEVPENHAAQQRIKKSSAGLSIETAGFVARNIKLHIFLIDPLVTIYAILFRIVIHGVVPPVEHRIGLSLIDGISIVASGIFLDHAACNVINFAITGE